MHLLIDDFKLPTLAEQQTNSSEKFSRRLSKARKAVRKLERAKQELDRFDEKVSKNKSGALAQPRPVQQKRGEKGEAEKKDDLNHTPVISTSKNSSRTKSSRQLFTMDPLVKEIEVLEVAETPKEATSSTINSHSDARPAEAQDQKSEHRQENESGESGIKIGRQGN